MNAEDLKLGFAGAATALFAVLALLFLSQGVIAEQITSQEVEIANESETVGVDIDFGENASANNVTADVTVLDDTGTEVANTSIDGTDGTVASYSFNVTDWEAGTYTVQVNATSPDTGVTASNHVGDVTIAVQPDTSSGGGGALFAGRNGKIAIGALVAVGGFLLLKD